MDELDDFMQEAEREVTLDPTIHWKNVWFKVLYMPRPTFDFIFYTDRKKHLWAIWILFGVLSGLSQIIDTPALAQSYAPPYVFGIITGVALVIVGLYALVSLTLKYFGKWFFSAQSTFLDMMIIQAWAVMPTLMSLVIQIVVSVLMLWVHPAGIHGEADLPEFASITVGFTRNVALIWSIVLTIIGIKQIQNISFGKSIANYVISTVLLILLLFGISMSVAFYYQRFIIMETNKTYQEMDGSYDEIIDRE